jgi:mono/diheme cytochrome c family protein
VSRSRRHAALFTVAALVGAFVLIQLVPYRVSDAKVVQEPSWDSARTRALARAACFDCHSNETHTYTWERVAPLSWWITNHVKEGRSALNFSECSRTGRGGEGEGDAAEAVQEGSMPPSYYTWFGLHGDAKLTPKEQRQLAAGLRATLQGWSCGEGD